MDHCILTFGGGGGTETGSDIGEEHEYCSMKRREYLLNKINKIYF